ncbi:MAG: tRNA preQ1(34) S-adenosylmethionine ribosyltransferase-isomerase QueA [Synergistales bacterium]|nr:tRNA preQ1(34) S-adenosylmethionine ribosyltransferase-isomerase QueA [Synergistales bacterium]
MRAEAYEYDLPQTRIAQNPVVPRDSSQLLVLDRRTGERFHRQFFEISEFLETGDTLVVNTSRVIPARLYGRKVPTGARIQILLIQPRNDCLANQWEAMVRPGKKAPPGTTLELGNGTIVTITERLESGKRLVAFDSAEQVREVLQTLGEVPFPPYIGETDADPAQYQTIYADEDGSIAAPTAGLHFTPELMATLREKGVGIAPVTLHVGPGTFQPVRAQDVREHHMHTERFSIPEKTAKEINETKGRGKRVIAVGTTAVRVLETMGREDGTVAAGNGQTDIFIYPGYEFTVIDGLITNFHLPRSTLLMLVAAFGGYEAVMASYREAVRQQYRFFSFGDAMLIL